MRADRSHRHTWRASMIGPRAQRFQCCAAAERGGNRDSGDQEEDHQTGALQIFVLAGDRDSEYRESYAEADRRKMIQQKMDVGQIHNAYVVSPLTGPTYAISRPAVIAPNHKIIE